ncbi:MAG: aspartyl/asparaginyl beta-hydroxylase domain-containing protein [Ktedonobacterales bacterium]
MPQNFRHLGQLDPFMVLRALAEIETNADLWGRHTLRQTYPESAHHDTETIYLRWAPEWTPESIFESTDAVDYPDEIKRLPTVTNLLHDAVLAILNAYPKQSGITTARMIITRLKPGGRIDEHSDQGLYAQTFKRFHVPLLSREGNLFACEWESVYMPPGGVWWFNHRRPHSVRNDSAEPRIHLILDAKLIDAESA